MVKRKIRCEDREKLVFSESRFEEDRESYECSFSRRGDKGRQQDNRDGENQMIRLSTALHGYHKLPRTQVDSGN